MAELFLFFFEKHHITKVIYDFLFFLKVNSGIEIRTKHNDATNGDSEDCFER